MTKVESVTASEGQGGHPAGFFFIFFGELAERFSYYGMRAILPLYLTTVLLYEDGEATRIYSLFKAACYLLPLVGGFLADRYFGKYWTIVGFSIPYVLGHFILGVDNRVALIFALVLLAGGSGVIKPNISTLMGLTYDQKRPGQTSLRSSAFSWFYFSINIGATISLAALPLLRDAFLEWTEGNSSTAYALAFQFPTWLMVVALCVFAAGKRHYATEVIDRTATTSPEESKKQWQVLGRLFGIFGLMVFFWVAYEQNDNIWTYFARDHVDLTLDLGFYQKTFPPDGFQWINGLFVLILVPTFVVLFRLTDPRGVFFRATTKILLGFLFTAGASVVMCLAASQATGDVKVSAWWIVLAYIVLTMGEVLLYGTGLELSFTAAPANMKGFITACFLLTNTLGNLINSQLSPQYETTIPKATFFVMTAGIVIMAGIAFYFVGRRFDRSAEAAA